MKIKIDHEAEIELHEAVLYYENMEHGLGKRFLHEFENSINQIKKYPSMWRKLTGKFRRCLIKDFPYGIIYQIREKELLVVAIANLHRKPGYWKDRI